MYKALILCKACYDGKNVVGEGIYTAAALSRLGISTSVCSKATGESLDFIKDFFGKYGVDDSLLNALHDISPAEFDVIFITGEFVLEDENNYKFAQKICGECKTLEIPVVFDPGGVCGENNRGIIKDIAVRSEVFVPSADDAVVFFGTSKPEEIADLFLSIGGNKIAVTLGKAGAYFKSRVESGFAPTFRADKVVDTMGAGDAFAAGLISGILEKIPLGEAVVRANACGCCAIQSKDFRFPDSSELREYMLTHRFVVEGCKDY